jgi:hypothetical protein
MDTESILLTYLLLYEPLNIINNEKQKNIKFSMMRISMLFFVTVLSNY